MATRDSMSGLVSEYSRLKTVPALLSVVFALTSLYQFGGISQVDLVWLNYTLTTQHAMLASLGTLLVAFASSETKEFDNYEDWEMAMIAAAPILIVGTEYISAINDLVLQSGDMVAAGAYLLTVVSWGVAIR